MGWTDDACDGGGPSGVSTVFVFVFGAWTCLIVCLTVLAASLDTRSRLPAWGALIATWVLLFGMYVRLYGRCRPWTGWAVWFFGVPAVAALIDAVTGLRGPT